MEAPKTNQTLLEVKELNISFQGSQGLTNAVDEVSFVLNKGKTLGIVGESGSGKSVTALSIIGLLPATQAILKMGSMFFYPNKLQPVELKNLPEKKLRSLRGNEISMIFQEPMTSLNPVMKCGKQVCEVLIAHKNLGNKEARAKVLELFQEVKLPRPKHIFSSFPHQLSGGQKQRVMIAMAMACQPSLLIADEPTTALDVTVQKTILGLMKELQDKYKTSILFITHDLGLIRQIADDVLVMHQGKIVEHGPVDQVFQHPSHPYTQGLLACRPRMDVRLRKLPTVKDYLNGNKSFDPLKPDDQLIITEDERKLSHAQLYSAEALISIRDLCTWFPTTRNIMGTPIAFVKAVNNVSFDVYPGETLGLVGESGSGKTTLGRSIIGLTPITSGEVIYRHQSLQKLSPKEIRLLRKKMQIIFQDPYSSLNPRLTIGDAILEPMKVHHLHTNDKARKKKTIELLERVGLGEEHYHRYPHEFSGGQRQRVGIARALALEPEFIVCDESVSALDVSVQAQVLNLLNDLKKDFGLTYIFISHDLSVVRFMSDRILVMKEGKLVEEGEADQVCKQPTEAYTRQLIEAIPL